MSGATKGRKRRWLASAVGAAVIMAGVLLLVLRLPAPAPGPVARTKNAQKPAVKLTAARDDELALRDLEPLFLPTRYNAAPRRVPQLEPGKTAFDGDPGVQYKFADDNPTLRLPDAVQPPANAVAALSDPPGPLALGIGHRDASIGVAAEVGGRVEVFSGESRTAEDLAGVRRRPVVTATLGIDARPMAAGRGLPAWQPLEFVAAVDVAGLVGPLLLTRTSGVVEVDNFFRNYLARTYRIGDRLPPGFYRIVVGP